jgi:hypothetical protein
VPPKGAYGRLAVAALLLFIASFRYHHVMSLLISLVSRTRVQRGLACTPNPIRGHRGFVPSPTTLPTTIPFPIPSPTTLYFWGGDHGTQTRVSERTKPPFLKEGQSPVMYLSSVFTPPPPATSLTNTSYIRAKRGGNREGLSVGQSDRQTTADPPTFLLSLQPRNNPIKSMTDCPLAHLLARCCFSWAGAGSARARPGGAR